MVRGHIKRPLVARDLHPFRLAGNQERGNALGGSILAGCPGKDDHMRAVMGARLPLLCAVDFEPTPDARRRRRHEGRIAAMVGLGETECSAEVPAESRGDEGALLLGRAEVVEHEDVWKISDDAVFVLQVIGEPQAAAIYWIGGHMEARGRHP